MITFRIDIQKIIDDRRITLTELSRITGVDKTHLSQIKRGQRATLKTLNRIASGIGEKDPTKLLSVEVGEVEKR